MSRSTFRSTEIECDGCANAIKKALGKVDGVSAVEVVVESQTIHIDHNGLQDTLLTAALDRAGFPVEG